MHTMHTPPAPPVPDRIPSKEGILSPEWTHAITTLMGHPVSSERGTCIQKWILYHAIPDHIEFWLTWDPTDPDTIPTRNGRELGEIWVSKVGTNF